MTTEETKPRRGRPPKPKSYEARDMGYAPQKAAQGLLKEFFAHTSGKRGQEAYDALQELNSLLNQYVSYK